MRTNKTIRLLWLLAIATSTIFISCSKKMEQTVAENSTTSSITIKAHPSSLRQSTSGAEDITNFLNDQLTDSTPIKNEMISKIIELMDMDKRFVEASHDEENLIIIPLANIYFTRHIDSNKIAPLQYLVAVEDEKGFIRRADLLLFYPTQTGITSLPENSFSDFFIGNPIQIDGTMTLITLEDIREVEMDFGAPNPNPQTPPQPPVPTHKTVDLDLGIASMSGTHENWTMSMHVRFNGDSYSDISLNRFTGQQTWHPGVTVPDDHLYQNESTSQWYFTLSNITDNATPLNSNRTEKVTGTCTMTHPYYNPVLIQNFGITKFYYAKTLLQ